MPFENAGPAEILRSVQKDSSFIEFLKGNIADVLQKTLGTELWLKYHKWIDNCCELVYFSLTTLTLRQTLGEEYSGLLLISHNKRSLPSIISRILMVCLQCLGPLIFSILVKRFECSLKSGFLSTYLRPKVRRVLQDQLSLLKALPSFILKLHLATFYLGGPFYHLAKRITGIRYVLIRSWLGDSSVIQSFRFLGLVVLINSFLSSLYSFWEQTKSKTESSMQECSEKPNKKCPLCLDRRKNPSVTPCGHLFCWHCIHESLQTNNVCPLCRYHVFPHQVVALMNYD